MSYETVTNASVVGSVEQDNGKTYVGCQKAIYLMANFPKYRVAVCRFEESKLKQTTMKTFFSVCPPQFYDPAFGGNRTDSMNTCKFINESEVLFMNLKDTDEKMVRGLEINTVLVDQLEEISEWMYLMLSARVGRWSHAEVPPDLLIQNPNWPMNQHGQYKIPSYFLGLCNPDSEMHFIWNRYHPDSEEYRNKYHRKHFMVQGATTTATVDEELLEEMEENDEAWVQRFVRGIWGIPGGAIHKLLPESELEVGKDISLDFVKTIIERGYLCRVLDHGDSSPTCCLWFSAYKGWYFCYREYYKGDTLISQHRKNISDLSGSERYVQSLIDPQCGKKTLQKYGGFWSHVEEYSDPNLWIEFDELTQKAIPAPPIYWTLADNNELATRNRISELLCASRATQHPVTQSRPSPRIFFIKRSPEYPNGCYHSIQQLKAQKRKKIGTINGKDIFSDDRAEGVTDHAYDPTRYYCASHTSSPTQQKPKAPPGSFHHMKKQYEEWKRTGKMPIVTIGGRDGRQYLQ